jgi:hypothetical protein
MDTLLDERKSICGELWPSNMSELSPLELFERVLICTNNYNAKNLEATLYATQRRQDERDAAAWDNAAQLYADELRVRLGGKGEVFQNG